MSKKPAKRKRPVDKLARFSVHSFHLQMDAVLRRLGKADTPKANRLRKTLVLLKKQTPCPQNMVLDLSRR